ncbi:glycosyltransferase [Entomospira entomophila]|uniref:Glycosyltransferase n=1 Tax=Entomospira entomophila TaxID=2719988 RepID=A0A968G8S6_9SPIO|nr:glycosyltransferase family 2 protein [Entomospira entomophilus]NIZ40086.1 glycosyltransferase [Entomospira entomophilus]WDI35647.1 glycosyltransferase [Entomospira entomophilus]
MLVSVIIPFYNVEAYFRRCLDSVVTQSYYNLEIILVNDCSSDDSMIIAQEYAHQDRRIQIIEHAKSLHVGGARNSGMAIATGEYIWFIDSDDELAHPYAIEHLVRIAQRDDSDIILFRAQMKAFDHQEITIIGDYLYSMEQTFHERREFWPTYFEVIYHDTHIDASFSPAVWAKFWKLSFLRRYQFQFLEHTIHQDIPLLMLLPLADRLTQLPYIFYYYYQRDESTMNSQAPAQYIQHFERIAEQLWSIYYKYWTGYPDQHLIVPVMLLVHLTFNTKRILPSQNLFDQEKWFLDVYDFLHKQLKDRGDREFFQPWPRAVENSSQWIQLIDSFHQDIKDSDKVILIHSIFYGSFSDEIKPEISIETKIKKLQKVIKIVMKMLLPYGVVRLIQTHQDNKY